MKKVTMFFLVVLATKYATAGGGTVGSSGSNLENGFFTLQFPPQGENSIRTGYASLEAAQEVKNTLDDLAQAAECRQNKYRSEIKAVEHNLNRYDELIRNSSGIIALNDIATVNLAALTQAKYFVQVQLQDRDNKNCFRNIAQIYNGVSDVAEGVQMTVRGVKLATVDLRNSDMTMELLQRGFSKEEFAEIIIKSQLELATEDCSHIEIQKIEVGKKWMQLGYMATVAREVNPGRSYRVCLFDVKTNRPVRSVFMFKDSIKKYFENFVP